MLQIAHNNDSPPASARGTPQMKFRTSGGGGFFSAKKMPLLGSFVISETNQPANQHVLVWLAQRSHAPPAAKNTALKVKG